MKRINFYRYTAFLVFMLSLTAQLMAQKQTNPRTRVFDHNWLFKKDGMVSGPEKNNFDASTWRKVELPHDWSIEDLPNQTLDSIVGPFSKASEGKINTGFTVGGTAWYRKSFKLNKAEQGKSVYIQFDGVYMNSDVWVNGHHLGFHPYGYTAFYYDITPYLLPAGKDNVIAVSIKNEGKNSRWYTGSGIYRHVWLTVVNPVHVDVWGIAVTTPKVDKKSTNVNIATAVKNAGKEKANFTLQVQIIDATGKVVATAQKDVTVNPGSKADVKNVIALVKPKFWSPQTPVLYQAKVTVLHNKKEVDATSTSFGVREIKMDPQQGLLINGVSVKLKGGCIHHDNGPLGSKAIDRAEERKVELLKANGFNAIRTSHNPPSQAFLDACDRQGMLVLEEAFDMWEKKKNRQDYHVSFNDYWDKDITSMIKKDRNHPSVFMWSIGNEIPERIDASGLAIRAKLVKRVHELDSTRKVTEAINLFNNWEKNIPSILKVLDVNGYNYLYEAYEKDRKSSPESLFFGSESYPMQALENWNKVEQLPYVIGDFVWTAMDYIGEAGIGRYTFGTSIPLVEWPWFNANCGDLDLVGHKKPQSYYRDVVWRNSSVEILVRKKLEANETEKASLWGWPNLLHSWNWNGEEGKTMQVLVYSRCPIIKLELNGKVIGEQKTPEGSITTTFEIPYQSGKLVAKGYKDGKEVGSCVLKTTGTPAAIRLKADREQIKANRNDLSYVTVEIVDAAGNVVPDAENIEVNFFVSGNGEIAGVGNANPTDVTSFQQPKIKVYHGKALAIIRPQEFSGKIVLKAQANGLADGSVEIVSR